MLRERVVHPRVKVTLLADLTLATTSIVPFTLSIAVAQPPSILISLFLPSTFRRNSSSIVSPGFLTPSKLCRFLLPRCRSLVVPFYSWVKVILAADSIGRPVNLVSRFHPRATRRSSSFSRPSIFRTLETRCKREASVVSRVVAYRHAGFVGSLGSARKSNRYESGRSFLRQPWPILTELRNVRGAWRTSRSRAKLSVDDGLSR